MSNYSTDLTTIYTFFLKRFEVLFIYLFIFSSNGYQCNSDDDDDDYDAMMLPITSLGYDQALCVFFMFMFPLVKKPY